MHTQHGKLVFAAASASKIAQQKPVQLLQATMATPPPRVIYKPKGPPGGLRKKGWSAKSLLIPGVVFGLLVLAYSVLNSMLVCICIVDSDAQVIPDACFFWQDRFYIFDLARLQQLQQEALDKHGNNTRAVVDDIVGHLRQEMPEYAISSTEEWVSPLSPQKTDM